MQSADEALAEDQTWVFGYGSLMWNPGFQPAERHIARLSGYHRAFCLASIEHRGTRDLPGLVLALDARAGAACAGVAYRMPDADRAAILAYLRARELVTSAYLERVLPIRLEDGRDVMAIAYVIDPDHWQYRGALAAGEQAAMIARAHGKSGANSDYLFNTAAHLAALGLPDAEMDHLCSLVRGILSPGAA